MAQQRVCNSNPNSGQFAMPEPAPPTCLATGPPMGCCTRTLPVWLLTVAIKHRSILWLNTKGYAKPGCRTPPQPPAAAIPLQRRPSCEPLSFFCFSHLRATSPTAALCRQVLDTVETRLPAEARRELHMLLRLLASRWGSMLLLGRAAFRCAAGERQRCSWRAGQVAACRCAGASLWAGGLLQSCLLRCPSGPAALPVSSAPTPPACCSGGFMPSPFTALPLEQREAVLLSWATGSDMRMRKVQQGRSRWPCSGGNELHAGSTRRTAGQPIPSIHSGNRRTQSLQRGSCLPPAPLPTCRPLCSRPSRRSSRCC